MENNVYAAPESNVNRGDSASVVEVYSPTQVACGAFVGGPVGLTYFLMSNFDSLGNYTAKTKALYSGIALLVVLMCLLPFLPDNFPNLPFTIGYVIAARYVAENYQIKKSEINASEVYDFRSNWKVFGVSLLCAIGSMILIAGPLIGLAMLGVIE